MTNDSSQDDFAKLFAQHSRWLHAYLLALLTDFSSAEEVFQEVCIVLWRKHEQFNPETDYRRWAAAIARNKVYQYFDKESRQARCLSKEVLELVAEEAIEQSDYLEERRRALHICLKKLTQSDRELVSACYSDANRSFRNASKKLNRPINTVYKALQRIRQALRTCIDRQLATSG